MCRFTTSQGNDIIPLVGTKTIARVNENASAVSVLLTDSERAQLSALPRLKVHASSPLAHVQRRRSQCRNRGLFVTTLQGLRYPEDVHASSYNARMRKQ
jgi:hypothetical protein